MDWITIAGFFVLPFVVASNHKVSAIELNFIRVCTSYALLVLLLRSLGTLGGRNIFKRKQK